MHALFALVGLLPRAARSVREMATFAIDYTLWLNVVSVVVVVVMFVLSRGATAQSNDQARA